jgi:PPM family protein phosphatase
MSIEPSTTPLFPAPHAASFTSIGRVRQKNQDSVLILQEQQLYIVSDGMGGHQAGEIASHAVISVLPELLAQQIAPLRAPTIQAVELILRDTVVTLSQNLRAQSATNPDLAGMGATLVMVWVRGNLAHLVNMGDSRIYLLRDGALRQITEDHSVVSLLLKYNEITPAEALTHPARGKLSRYIGMEGEVYPDVASLPIGRGDRMLLCTDGLTNMLSNTEITNLLNANPEPSAVCRALVTAANAAGGTDNITALVINFS